MEKGLLNKQFCTDETLAAATSVGSRLQNREDYTMLSNSFIQKMTFIYDKYIHMNNSYMCNYINIVIHTYNCLSIHTRVMLNSS